MDVITAKEFFRKTEIGKIAKDWEVKKISEIAKVNSESINSDTPEDYEFYYYDLSAVDKGKVYHPNEKIKYKEAPSRAKRLFKENDILMSTVRPNLQGFVFVDFDAKDCICSTGFAVITGNDTSDSLFLYHNLYSYVITGQIQKLIVGSNYPAINKKDVENLKIPYPTNRAEREKIANILSTWDKAIELKEKLIEQKKEEKKGLLQRLLTGEVRFPGFNEVWKAIRLGDYLIKHNEKSQYNNQHPVLTSSRKGIFLQRDYYLGNEVASEDNTGYNVVPYGYFTYRHMSDDLTFKFNINDIVEKGIVSTLYPVFTTKKELNSYFLLLKLNEGNEFKRFALTQKQGGSRTYMYYSKLEELKLVVPSLEEQNEIAEFFSVIEKDILLLERELDYLKKQKKGLMQLLLTGEIRVKV